MSNDADKQSLLDAIALLRLAEGLIVDASRDTDDPSVLIQLNTEFRYLDSFISQLLHALAIADDATFASATTAISQQVTGLEAEEADIQKIVEDVSAAAKIVGYIAQAASILGRL